MVTSSSATNGNATPPQPQFDPHAVKQQAGDAAQSLMDQAQQTAGMAAEQVKQTATTQLGTQKGRATASLTGLADSLHQAGTQLEASDQSGFFAKYAHQAAGTVEQVANHLDERDINELIAEVEDYARQQPAIFLGGAFVLGVLGARFLKSSGQRQPDSDMSNMYNTPSRTASAYRAPAMSGTHNTAAGASNTPSTSLVTPTPPTPPASTAPRTMSGTNASPTSNMAGMSSTGDNNPARSAVRMAPSSTPTANPSRVEDADRLDALRRGEVPHQMGATEPAAPGATPGQSVRTGTGDTARNTETH